MKTELLADQKKGKITDEGDFLRTAENHFTSYYQPLIPCVNRLRRLVFPDRGRWQKPNPDLPKDMIRELQRAREDPDIIGAN